MKTDLLKSETWKKAMANIIVKLEEKVANQQVIDDLYLSLCSSLFKELDEQLEYKNANRQSKKRF